jgi:hypothetical protein
MKPSPSSIKQALDLVIRAVSERPDGEVFVPIVLHLEKQLAEIANAETEYERIIRLARKSAEHEMLMAHPIDSNVSSLKVDS